VGIRVRQPLGAVYAVIPPEVEVAPALLEILRDELNVREVRFMERAEELVEFSARPNFRALGARFGKRTPAVAEAIRALPSAALAAFRRGEGLAVELDGERLPLEAGDFEIVQTTRGELAVQAEGPFTLAVDPTLTPELRAEGVARELVNRVQRLRKDAGLQLSDRIRLGVAGGAELRATIHAHRDFVARETLAVEVEVAEDGALPGAWPHLREVDLDGLAATIALAPVLPFPEP
ncbi:MAG: DUF5915 domain-containing protein, partial [Gemmatimonadota bacterium]|nr:DUF5915 domain-containing protein [Gemmatimonadota bacterium]